MLVTQLPRGTRARASRHRSAGARGARGAGCPSWRDRGRAESAGGGTFSFRYRGQAAGSGGSLGNGGSRTFTFSRGTSMASTKFKAPRRLNDDRTGDGDDDEVDQEESSSYSSSSFVFRGSSSFQSARWQGSHEGFDGGSGGSYSHRREEAEEPLRGQALMNAARARAEAGPSSFSSATRRPTTSGGLAKKKKRAKTVDLF